MSGAGFDIAPANSLSTWGVLNEKRVAVAFVTASVGGSTRHGVLLLLDNWCAALRKKSSFNEARFSGLFRVPSISRRTLKVRRVIRACRVDMRGGATA
jgi:hypothetical protein